MPLPAHLQPTKPGAEDVACMQARVDFMQYLYEKDGRDSPDHPQHGHFTGLLTDCAECESGSCSVEPGPAALSERGD